MTGMLLVSSTATVLLLDAWKRVISLVAARDMVSSAVGLSAAACSAALGLRFLGYAASDRVILFLTPLTLLDQDTVTFF